ncbi:heat shock cognate 70 kDa protein-like protein [Tanacetum coccineum]
MGGEAPAIGIDLGTTYSCVAVWKHDRIEIIANDQGNRTTPSCVAFNDEERLIGDGAKNQICMNPANTVFDAKRMIGRRFSDAKVQHDMKLWPFKVIEGFGDMPKIVVTYKGHEKMFTTEEISAMRQATKDAATIAGLNVVRMINEPTAAAIAYGLDNWSMLIAKRNVLVFDLGGGTFDVSLLTIDEGGTFEVKAVAGDTHLGGQDFDNTIANYCAKRVLSYATQASIELDLLHEGNNFSMKFTRAKFEELNMNYFTECMKKLQACLTDAKVDKESVDDVILVGGSTRIPKVQCMLQEFFNGKQLYKSINPDEAVAYGAAVMAAKLCGDTNKMLKNLVLMDVTPLSLGTEVKGEIMSVLIPRNTPIPTKKGVSKVEDCFEIDANGILTAKTKVVSTGKIKSLTVSNHSGRLLKQQMEKMVNDAEKLRIEDQEEYKRKVDAYNSLEDCFYALKNKIKGNDTPLNVFKNMKYALKDTKKWLSSNKVAEVEAKREYLEFISKLAFSD